jgi:1L-myo-inositol 1-phosphate cytidylyltransferase
MKAVILAAGDGGRLGLLTAQRPKALLPLVDRPIIDYVIASLAGAGLRDVVVVLGHCGEMLQEHLGDGCGLGVRVEYVWNRQYRWGNARSLWCAREALARDPFVLAMSDHLCSASLVRALCAAAGRRSVLAVDSSDLGPERTREATKVLVSPEHRVLNLGKGLLGWNAVDTGLVYCVPAVFDLMWPDLRDGELSQVMAALARWERAAGGLEACDVSGRFWMDIDTEADLHLAESLLRRDVSILA